MSVDDKSNNPPINKQPLGDKEVPVDKGFTPNVNREPKPLEPDNIRQEQTISSSTFTTDVSHGSNIENDLDSLNVVDSEDKENNFTKDVYITPSPISATAQTIPPHVSTTGSGSVTEKPDIITGKASVTAPPSTVEANGTVNVDVGFKAEVHITPSPERATHHSLNDVYSSDDSIGFKPYVNALSKLICHRDTQTPLVIGIFGKWGQGKTSFMRQIEASIESFSNSKGNKNKFVKQVWFNAWKYDVKKDLWAALLQAITSQVEKDINVFKKIWCRFRKLNNSSFWVGVFFMLSVVLYIGAETYDYVKTYDAVRASKTENAPTKTNTEVASTSDKSKNTYTLLVKKYFPASLAGLILYFFGVFKPIVELYRKIKKPLGLDVHELLTGKDYPNYIESLQSFEKELDERLDAYLDEDGRLIVYIDDLDRCSPTHAVEVIEAINLFLETKRCVFVLGMDHNLVSKSIGVKYKDISKYFDEEERECLDSIDNPSIFDNRKYGEIFLDKIIQVPIRIPEMTKTEKIEFSKTLMSIGESNSNQNNETKFSENEVKDNLKTEAEVQDVDISLTNDIKKCVMTIIPYLESNPRTFKRFYNMLTLVHYFYIGNRKFFGDVNEIALTMWFFIKYRFGDEIDVVLSKERVTWGGLMSVQENGDSIINSFFIEYTKNKDNLWVMNNLEGEINDLEPITRFLFI